jgi:hypothetical protein
MGEFLLKLHRSAKLLHPHRMCERNLTYCRRKSSDGSARHLPHRSRRRRRVQRLRSERVRRRPEREIPARISRLRREHLVQGQRGVVPGGDVVKLLSSSLTLKTLVFRKSLCI